MGSGIAHIISPLSAPWCGWMMFALLLCAVLSEFFQPGIITQAVSSSLLTRANRTYKEAPSNFLSQTLISLFRIGTLAMAICLCFCTDDRFSLLRFLAVCGIIVGVLIVKMLCNKLIDYTFMISRRFGAAYEHYSNIATIGIVVLYPILLILLRFGNPIASQWALGCVLLIFIVLWVYRSGRMYITSPMAILYFALYIVTIELLPLGLLLYVSAKTISII